MPPLYLLNPLLDKRDRAQALMLEAEALFEDKNQGM